MGLLPGSRLGPYEIVAPIGAGGMGEVYKAQDTRLERTVAVKVLPQHLSSSAESRQRFEREAKTISQLSHPHICALYDVGSEGETEYLVMEYLEGETLADRLGKGALPLEQTLRYGSEMADALDKAHRQGIVHRDLKPGNVMLTKSGVKLLDFGLAKAMAPVTQQSGLTSLPTVAGAANLTQAGTILGTFQYMSPEQLEGKEADARTDIFALGAVLYEMVTGRKAFSGTSQASLISAIMKEEPSPVSALAPMTPPAFDRVVKTCLAKDPEDRWQSAHDVGNELKWIAEGSQAGVPTRVSAKRKSRERLAWALVGLLAALAAVLAVGYVRRAPRPAPLVRASIVPPEKLYVTDLAVSPDGRRLAFTASKLGDRPSLWIRELDGESPRPVTGAEEASFPFWSPDSRFVAFFADGKLRKVDPSGGAVLVVCDAEVGAGGSWNQEGTIVFAPLATSPLFQVPASGGKPVPVTKLDASRHEAAHRYPYFLPDGRHFLYTATALGGATDETSNGIRVASLDGRQNRALVSGYSNAQFASGRLLYVREDALFAQRLDLARWEVHGDPVMTAPRVGRPSEWGGYFAFSASESSLVLEPQFTASSRLLWFDRAGKEVASVGELSHFGNHRLSADGRRVATVDLNTAKNTLEIWVYDNAPGAGTKFVFGSAASIDPVWSPDGTRVVFASDRGKTQFVPNLWVKALDGSSEEPFLQSEDNVEPLDWSRDGRFLAIIKVPLRGKRNDELWALDAADRHHQIPVATGAPHQSGARFSPDGKWIAYASDESGGFEVYVRPFPGPGGRWKVSTAGGVEPRWRSDGKELFYASLDHKIMAVPVVVDSTFHAGKPVTLFPIHPSPFGNVFDVSADGQKFLVNSIPEDAGSPPLTMLLNWTGLLAKSEPVR
jgi:Tol biopolymer transport system component